jgi:cyclic pyranopterin phosphate synthase
MPVNPLTHLDADGHPRMVDVAGKADTVRTARAEGFLRIGEQAQAALRDGSPKGDVLAVAQLAGIQGAKRTSDLIPLCHPIPIDHVAVSWEEREPGVYRVESTVRTTWRTGVEMEALTAVSAALLTAYDMLKAADKAIEMGPIRLVEKAGGKSGAWSRS